MFFSLVFSQEMAPFLARHTHDHQRFAPPEGKTYPRGPRVFLRIRPSGPANPSKFVPIRCQCTLGTRGRAGTPGDSMTVGTSHASRRGNCTQRIGVHAWLVPTVMESGVGACGRASSAVRAVPRPPRDRDLSFFIRAFAPIQNSEQIIFRLSPFFVPDNGLSRG